MESATFFQKVQKKKRCVYVSSETEEANVTKYWQIFIKVKGVQSVHYCSFNFFCRLEID